MNSTKKNINEKEEQQEAKVNNVYNGPVIINNANNSSNANIKNNSGNVGDDNSETTSGDGEVGDDIRNTRSSGSINAKEVEKVIKQVVLLLVNFIKKKPKITFIIIGGIFLFLVVAGVLGKVQTFRAQNHNITVNPYNVLDVNISGYDGEATATCEVNNKKLNEEKEKYNSDELERMQTLVNGGKCEVSKDESITNGDQIKATYNVDEEILKENHLTITGNPIVKEAEGLQSQEELEKEKYESLYSVSEQMIADYIEVETGVNKKYSDPVQIGERDSRCGYTAIDYAVEVNGGKRYLTSLIYDPNQSVETLDEEVTNINVVKEGTELYQDESCGLTQVSGKYAEFNFSDPMPENIYSQLISISSAKKDDYVETETSTNETYSDLDKLDEYILNDEQFVVVYKGVVNMYHESNFFLFVNIFDVYVSEGKIVDYNVDVHTELGEDMDYAEAKGQQLNSDDKKRAIEFE